MVERPAAAHEAEPKESRRGWRRLARVVGFALFVIVGAVAAKGGSANGVFYHSTGEVIGALLTGVVIGFFFLLPVLVEREGRRTGALDRF
ncbi:MAG: hypothetical protein ACYDHH_34700 [Solirubrobacteraceae bacterium]